jgi:hypothetical protein
MLVGVWTVNDPARARVLSTLGVDYIVSDNPGSVTAALAKAGQCGCIQRKLGMTRASFGYGTGGELGRPALHSGRRRSAGISGSTELGQCVQLTSVTTPPVAVVISRSPSDS